MNPANGGFSGDGLPFVIALGSNLGDRISTIRSALVDFGARPGVVVERMSSLIETPALKPTGVDYDAPAYVNAVATGRTELQPHELLRLANDVELSYGRVRETRWGDRTLDIDLIVLGDLQLDTPDLTVPHPRAFEREFVLAPWLEIDPDAVIPGRGSVADLLARVAATEPDGARR